jgi:hypothetical protein
MIEMVKEEHVDKERIKEGLRKVGETARGYLERIDRFRGDIESILNSRTPVEPQ